MTAINKTFPQRLARIALILALLLPIYFMIAALGTKFGLWGWQFGLGTLTIAGGPLVLGTVAIIALVALIWILLRAPRKGWWMAALALSVPVLIFITLAGVGDRAAANPLHDVATDTANPPQYSEAMLTERAAANAANTPNDYAAPLSELGKWKGERFAAWSDQNHQQIIMKIYPDLEPIIVDATIPAAVQAVSDAMDEAGFVNIRDDLPTGRVEGTSETFWFGFKDDVVARIESTGTGPDARVRIDFRSLSRVGLSDLGANAERVKSLRAAVASKLS